MTREALIQSMRTILKAALSLTDDQVIPQHDDGVRPAPPYIQVRATSFDIPYGSDEANPDADGDDAAVSVSGERTATVGLALYGDADWLSTFAGILARPDVQALLATEGITLRPLGGERDLSIVRDSQWELQTLREFVAGWVRSSASVAVDAVSTVDVAVTYPREPGEGSPPALSDSVSVDL